MSICQCDSIEWSCRGRYAIFSFGGKEDEDGNSDKSVIYVWDQRKQDMIRKFGSPESGIVLENFTFVLKAHPKLENFFVSGGGAGKVILWDIQKATSLNTFKETGIYQRDENILNEVFDGKFSTCGKTFVMSTVSGTFTIYSIYDKESYLATPVEQFFHLDRSREQTSLSYLDNDAFLVNFDRMKYTEQPPFPIIGERYIERYMAPSDYEQKYKDRFSKFSKDQKFFENYDIEFAPYAFLNNRVGGADQSLNDNDSESYNGSQPQNNNHRNQRSVYFDPYNNNFDRDSDEDFIVESSPDRNNNRRTLRRIGEPVQRMEERKQPSELQNQARQRRSRQRNRLRNDDSNDEPEDSVVDDVVENEESEVSDESLVDYSNTKKPVVRNHNFASSRIQEESESEEIAQEKSVTAKSEKNSYPHMFSTSRVVLEEEEKGESIGKTFSNLMSSGNNENYIFEQQLKEDGYRIDTEEALQKKDEDKSLFSCAL